MDEERERKELDAKASPKITVGSTSGWTKLMVSVQNNQTEGVKEWTLKLQLKMVKGR